MKNNDYTTKKQQSKKQKTKQRSKKFFSDKRSAKKNPERDVPKRLDSNGKKRVVTQATKNAFHRSVDKTYGLSKEPKKMDA